MSKEGEEEDEEDGKDEEAEGYLVGDTLNVEQTDALMENGHRLLVNCVFVTIGIFQFDRTDRKKTALDHNFPRVCNITL